MNLCMENIIVVIEVKFLINYKRSLYGFFCLLKLSNISKKCVNLLYSFLTKNKNMVEKFS